MSEKNAAAVATSPTQPTAARAKLSWSQTMELRPASKVMSPERMAAAYPNALSFSRIAMRDFVRRRWKVERLRIDLDQNGQGEALYRIAEGKWLFHFFVVSTQLPPTQQIDRNFASSWDATVCLCEGAWTAEREALLRNEVPKQNAGKAWVDYDTLMLSRGNRSGRLFEHVVESLAAGRQPDPHQLSEIGYIFRTTGFGGNGLAGTRPYQGYPDDHPLKHPYHPQVCAAFLFREFVFDLVEHIAGARSTTAVKLDPNYKRYLGLGNSAAAGLMRYAFNHPLQMDHWCTIWESAFAEAKGRLIPSGGGELAHLKELLAKAKRYLQQDSHPLVDGAVSPRELAKEIGELRTRVVEWEQQHSHCSIAEVCAWADHHLSSEAIEIAYAIVLELFPDIIDIRSTSFHVDERFYLEPAMTNRDLQALIRTYYGWTLGNEAFGEEHNRFFWFHSFLAPADARRGYRGVLPPFEAENAMEVFRSASRALEHLALLPDDLSVAEIVTRAPEFRHFIARAQTLRTRPYAHPRVNPLNRDFQPIPVTRLVLAFYGMEKYEAVLPKVVRGALLQGAPIAEDVAAGIDGTWPFPPFPDENARPNSNGLRATNATTRPTIPIGGGVPKVRPAARPSTEVIVSKTEFVKRAQNALQAAGAPLGLAVEAAELFAFSEATRRTGLAELLGQIGTPIQNAARSKISSDGPNLSVLDAEGGNATVISINALDLACSKAFNAPNALGATLVLNAPHQGVIGGVAFQAATRGLTALMLRPLNAGGNDLEIEAVCSAAGAPQPWFLQCPLQGLTVTSARQDRRHHNWQPLHAVLAGTHPEAVVSQRVTMLCESLVREIANTHTMRESFIIVCSRTEKHFGTGPELMRFLDASGAGRAATSRQMNEVLQKSWLSGFRVRRTDWAELDRLSERLLLSNAQEAFLREPGFDHRTGL